VLPFQNLSDDKTNIYFADGVQDEILTTLAKVADLKVISRTSVMQFRNSGKRNLRDIARQLGVAHVLEGTVQRVENRVRVTAQLIDARTDAHIWADRYDGELADVFAIQSEIAQKIAAQLKAALSPTELAALAAKPTRDTAAYELYLRAKEIIRDGSVGGRMGRDAVKEVTLLDEAVARDPAFVPALCLLTRAHLQAYWFGEDHTPARLELARKALEAAARLQPDSGEVHLARALFHYWGSRDYASALTDLALAANSLPNDGEVLFYIASIERRQGRCDEAIKTTDRALVLDPRNGRFTLNQSWTYRMLRRYDDARRVIDSLLAWKTEDVPFQLIRAEIDLEEKADLTPMQEILSRDLPASTDRNVIVTYRVMLASFQRDYPAAEKALAEHGPWEVTQGFSTPREYFEGFFARGRGESERAAAAFLRARERAAAPVIARPDDAKALIVLAKIDAKLGRKEEAVREAERAVELLPVSTDAFDGPLMLVRLAKVYAEVGQTDRAIEVLQQAAALPGGPSYGILQVDAEFDPLRKDSRFEKILVSLSPKQKR
jgi:serine/threonine-protein kinase